LRREIPRSSAEPAASKNKRTGGATSGANGGATGAHAWHFQLWTPWHADGEQSGGRDDSLKNDSTREAKSATASTHWSTRNKSTTKKP
jgi:hypothetical protein